MTTEPSTPTTAGGTGTGAGAQSGSGSATAGEPTRRPPRFEPTRVVVTGSDSGIGRATAVALAARGRHVGITWHEDEAGAEATADEVRAAGASAYVAHLDLREPASGARVVDELAEQMGGIDTLVLCSGTGTSTLLLEMDLDAWREVVSVDLDGAFACLQAGARRMVAAGRGGRIVAITSVHEHAPRVGAAPYCAAKGGLGLLVKVAALELAEHGITVNAVAPGEIATPMTGQEDESPVEGKDRPGIPVARPGDAREIAATVAFLCGPDAGYVNGASWVVDGGMLGMGPQAGSHLESHDWRRP
ncbi:SDR family oxidoreductase [Actinotalea ferrariae]|uniref:SDR family oxidoreductase n=1 Tax=Actinotalea ferrariae TaxID=1386098 RepID=UPI001C8CBA83|nr:SDR family oxidoreductase [Actinotalea ferrariae]MBX9245561.1 SDR family oxidoreductase [Actinotalea ferrariae]